MRFRSLALRAVSVAAAAAALVQLIGCSDKKTIIDEDVLSVNSFLPDYSLVKPLGRTHVTDSGLWLAYSGSGAEFSFNGNRLSVTMSGDDYIDSEDFDSLPRIAIFLDGERAVDAVLDDPVEVFTVLDESEPAEHTVRIVKLSETGNSTCLISSIEASAYGAISPTPEKERSIEFIGDSITCGYGVDAEDQNKSFSTRTEDASKSYAYKAAELLDADYSLVSKSGHGIISGYSGDGSIQSWGVMPDYYESFGSGGGAVGGVLPDSVKWDFDSTEHDAVVINLGTNDFSYTGNDPAKCEQFQNGYVEFLKRVRELNPSSKIFCVLGVMGDGLYSSVEAAAKSYTDLTGDGNIACLRLTPQSGADGYGADWHPSDATHTKAAVELSEFIKAEMGWE